MGSGGLRSDDPDRGLIIVLAGMAGAGAVLARTGDAARAGRRQARFRVELADDEAERAQGLMNRDSLRGRPGCCSSIRAAAGRRSG